MGFEYVYYKWCFRITKVRRSNLTLNEILTKINYFDNEDDYIIMKATNRFKIVTYQDFTLLKYGGYIFVKKSIINYDNLNSYFNYLSINKIDVPYLNVTTFQFYLINNFDQIKPKIKIIDSI